MKGSLAGPPTLAARTPPSGRSLRPSTPPFQVGAQKAHAQLAAARELHDGVEWLPAGRLALTLLQDLLQAAFAAEGLSCTLRSSGDADRVDAAPAALEALLRATVRFQRALGWETVSEEVLGPDAASWSVADLSTPRLQPGRELVIHAERNGARWETGRLRDSGLTLQGRVCAFVPTLLRLAAQGPWPGRLAPTQVDVLPVGADQAPLAHALCAELRAHGLRAETRATGTIARRVREAGRRGVPGVAVVGAEEQREGSVALRWRGEREALPRAELVARIRALLDSHAPSGASFTPRASHQRTPSPADGHSPVAEPSTGVLSH